MGFVINIFVTNYNTFNNISLFFVYFLELTPSGKNDELQPVGSSLNLDPDPLQSAQFLVVPTGSLIGWCLPFQYAKTWGCNIPEGNLKSESLLLSLPVLLSYHILTNCDPNEH